VVPGFVAEMPDRAKSVAFLLARVGGLP